MAKSNWLFAIQGWIRLGFGIEAAMDGPGLGLISIQERILSLNGSVSIVSKPGQGTEILVRVPVSDNMQPAAQNQTSIYSDETIVSVDDTDLGNSH